MVTSRPVFTQWYITQYNGWMPNSLRAGASALISDDCAGLFRIGSQSGSVLSVTKTSPSRKWSRLFASRITVAFPPMDSPNTGPSPTPHLGLEVIATQDVLTPGIVPGWVTHKQFASDAILRPLNVHRGVNAPYLRIVVFNQTRPTSQLENFVIKSANFPVP